MVGNHDDMLCIAGVHALFEKRAAFVVFLVEAFKIKDVATYRNPPKVLPPPE